MPKIVGSSQEKKARGPRITQEQVEVIVTFMEEHQDFANSKLDGLRYRFQNRRLGQDLEKIVNACGSSKGQKSEAAIKKYWSDLKTKVRAKTCAINAQRRLTGSSVPISTLTPLETRVLNVIGEKTSIGVS